MMRMVILSVSLVLLPSFTASALEDGQQGAAPYAEAKELSGMSIVGNDEAPKSLTIVPWKSSELGAETGLTMRLDGDAAPVDREVFLRQLAYHRASTVGARSTP